jgi:hypothetical protein
MFPRSQRFTSLLLEEIEASHRWCPFVSELLSESAKDKVLSRLLEGKETAGIDDSEAATRWVEQVQTVIGPIAKLEKHCVRTTQESLRKYINASAKLVENFKRHATRKLYNALLRRASYSGKLYEAVAAGKNVNGLVEELLRIDDVVESTNSLIEELVDHEKFVRKLESTFKISVQEFEPIREGVFVYLDQENTNKLEDALKTAKDVFDTINDEMGYLLLRKGVKSDMEFGPFGESLTCWTFVYAPVEDQKDDEGEVKKKGPFKPLKLKMTSGDPNEDADD